MTEGRGPAWRHPGRQVPVDDGQVDAGREGATLAFQSAASRISAAGWPAFSRMPRMIFRAVDDALDRRIFMLSVGVALILGPPSKRQGRVFPDATV
jgi:hypothetical protein